VKRRSRGITLFLAESILIGTFGASIFQSQSRPTGTSTLAFEVASIKPNRSVNGSWSIECPNSARGTLAGGRCRIINASLQRIIGHAYDLPMFSEGQYMSGGPSWIRTERYDIDAKAENGSASAAELRLMLQNLLADRFSLKLHEESRQITGYALVVTRGGPKLKPIGESGERRRAGARPNPVAIGATDTESLAMSLSIRLGVPVVDRTNIAGDHDFTLTMDLVYGNDGPSIFTLIQEQFGLKLESQKALSRILVIDQVEKPTAN